MAWEISCPACHRSSNDERGDDESADRCPVCGQWPTLDDDADGACASEITTRKETSMRFTVRFRHGTGSFCPGCDSPYCTATFRDSALLIRNREEAQAIRDERKQRESTPDPLAHLSNDIEAWKVQSYAYESFSPRTRAAIQNLMARDATPTCHCETTPLTRKLYLYRERGEALMDDHEWRILQDGFRTYNATPKWERRDWLRSDEWGASQVRRWFEMINRAEEIEACCPANVHYPTLLRDEWYGNDVETSADEAKATVDAERYETLEFRRHRAHGLPWHERYDDDSPYARDPQLVLSKGAWDREYGAPREVDETVATGRLVKGEQVRDVDGDTNVITVWRPEYTTQKRTVKGAIWWEYDRRVQGRQPWMHPKTYRWCLDLERARALKQRQRSRIVRLVKALGGDPRKPEVSAWVTERGYESALASLEARAAREGVVV